MSLHILFILFYIRKQPKKTSGTVFHYISKGGGFESKLLEIRLHDLNLIYDIIQLLVISRKKLSRVTCSQSMLKKLRWINYLAICFNEHNNLNNKIMNNSFVRCFFSIYILNLEPEIFPNKRSKASRWIF